MDIAKNFFSNRDYEGYVGKEDHNVICFYVICDRITFFLYVLLKTARFRAGSIRR